jgi:acyl carrier protein
MSQELTQKVIAIIADTQKIAADTITPESTFEELGIDSMDGVNIVFALENEFDINIPDDDAKEVRSVRDIAQKLDAWLARKAASDTAGPPPQP